MRRKSSVILVVDDSPDDVFFLKRAFSRAGVRQQLQIVQNGQEALEYLKGEGCYQDRSRYPIPCLVLLDVNMPRVNGLEVLRWLRANEELKDLPVCMVTSSNEPQDRGEAQLHGIEAYCVKPVSFEQLVKMAQEIREEAEEHCEGPESCENESKTPQ